MNGHPPDAKPGEEVEPTRTRGAVYGSADEPSKGNEVRVRRLLEYDGPDSTVYALARFAAEAVVAALPDAALEEHEVLMDTKLADALLVEEALDDLAELEPELAEAVRSAAAALRAARFYDVEATLAEAERSRADTGIREKVRNARAETALLRDDAAAAAEHYVAGAKYLEAEEDGSESREATMLFRSRAVGRLIRHADTFGGDGGWIDGAMELCNANIRYRDTHVWNQGARQMDAGAAQLSAGRVKAAPEALDLFLGAEYSFRIASWHFDKGRFPGDWAAAQSARGLAQAHFCFRYEEARGKPPPEGSWSGAEDCYRSAMDVQLDGWPVRWAKTRINLGYLLVHRGRAEGAETGERWLRQAVEDCRGAQQALRADVETDVWVDAQQIIAEALLELAELARPEDATNHLLQATLELTTAKDVLAGEPDGELTFEKAGVDRLMARLERLTARLGGA